MKKAVLVKILVVTMLSVALDLISCKKDEPLQPHVTSVQLSVEDASCTEAWLKVSLSDASDPRTVAIQQDGQRVLTVQMLNADSLCVIEGLFPRHTYTFVAQRVRDTTAIDASSPVQATTMDTTSHNFTFHLDTLGITSSMLSDVSIVNDTLAYAVGEIYLLDSLGQFDDTPYNMARWDGQEWHPMRTQFFTICGQPSRTPYPAKSVFAFGGSDVWIAMEGDQIARWNSNTQTSTMCLPISFSITKLWGSSPYSMYAVGQGGHIAHYNGVSWRPIENGTTVTLNDVWGGSNRWVGENVVLVAAGNKYTAGETELLRITSSGVVDTISWQMQDRVVNSVWFDAHSSVYTSGGGVFCYRGGTSWSEQPIPLIYTNRIRGNAQNDLWAVGDYGVAAHFNGFTWRVFQDVRLSFGNYESVAVKGNLMIAVGWIGNRAVILRGAR